MASTAVRLQTKLRFRASPTLLRSLCSSTPSPPMSVPASSDEPSASGGDLPPPTSSHFTDIKTSLRKSSAPSHHIPLNPPKPDVRIASTSKIASLEEIRKNLSEFSRRASSSNHPNSSPSNISLMDLFSNSTPEKPGDDGGKKPDRFSFHSIQQSLRQLAPTPGESPGTHGRSKGTQYNPVALGAVKERLNISPVNWPSRSEKLPHSIFGKELEEGEGEDSTAANELKTEFLHMYSHDELGEKLRKLRPAEMVSAKERNGSLSLQELNQRLAKMRRMDEKQLASRSAYFDLRDSLSKLKDVDAAKKQTINNLSFLAHLGGHFTPSYMLGDPKEHLLEKYFHPDLMSSGEKLKLELKKVRDEFKMSESDCGSARVQVAQLTTKIKHLSSVLSKKDKHSQKGLQAMVQRRKKLLKYLRKTDWDSYCFVLSRLGLRDAADYRISKA